MGLSKKSVGILSIFSMLLAGCETINPFETSEIKSPVSSFKGKRGMQPHVAQALAFLKEGKYPEASTFINQTLQSQPKSVVLHTLNALTYEKLAETGDGAGLELAIVGYQNALNLDPFNVFAITQLGKIRYRDQQYDEAQEHFANALLITPNDPDLIHEFAAASYYAYDIKTALASIRKAEKLKPQDPLIQRSAAMMHAAAGDFKEAEKHFKLFQDKAGNDPQVEHVANRFNDWQSLYKSGRLTLAAAQSTPITSSTTSTSSSPSTKSSTTSTTTTATTSSSSDETSAADTDEGITVDAPPPDKSEVATAQEFASGSQSANIVDVPVTPGISATPADGSPAPKPVVQAPKAPPQPVNPQIIIDCYVLEIAETAGTSKGNNILNTLAVTLNPGSFIKFNGNMTGSATIPVTPDGSSGGDTVSDKPDYASSLAFLQDPTGKTTPLVTPSAPNILLNNTGSLSGRIFAAGLT